MASSGLKNINYMYIGHTAEAEDHIIGHKNMVCQDRWSLMAAVSQDRFHCIGYFRSKEVLAPLVNVFFSTDQVVMVDD